MPSTRNSKLKTRNCDIRIGCSGWHYKHWIGNYYPPKLPHAKMLEHYLRDFDTVEINNSFYMLPQVKTFECWRDSTPPGFVFAVKASRFITHNKKLKEPENALENFLPRAEALASKLGPVLFQLPPSWKVNAERLEEFLSALPREHRYTVEFREPSWNTERVYEALRRYNVAYCIYHLAGFHSPIEITADFTYIRLHGPGGKYQGSYDHEGLSAWAARIEDWSRELKAVYIYFDNDQAGYAAFNAIELKRTIANRSQRRAA